MKFYLVKKYFLSFLVLSVIFTLGCGGPPEEESVRSGQVTTGEFHTRFAVIDSGSDELNVRAQITQRSIDDDGLVSDEYINLIGDELWFANGSTVQRDVAGENNLFDDVIDHVDSQAELMSADDEVYSGWYGWSYVYGTYYTVNVDRPGNTDNVYSIALVRGNGGGIFNSSVTLPRAFDIMTPSTNHQFDRSTDSLDIIWSDPSPEYSVRISAEVNCLSSGSASFEFVSDIDEGLYTFEPGVLDDTDLLGACSNTIKVEKISLGTLNSSFAGGLIQGIQSRSFTARSSQ